MEQGIRFFLGVVFGTGLVCIVMLIVKISNRQNKGSGKYDERQLWARGRAYQYGFISIMFSVMLSGFIVEETGWWCTIGVFCFTNVIVGLFAFVTVSIINDAFFSVNESYKYRLGLLIVCGLLNLTNSLRRFLENHTLLAEDGKFDDINLECGLFIFYVAILLLIKLHKSKEDGDEYEES